MYCPYIQEILSIQLLIASCAGAWICQFGMKGTQYAVWIRASLLAAFDPPFANSRHKYAIGTLCFPYNTLNSTEHKVCIVCS